MASAEAPDVPLSEPVTEDLASEASVAYRNEYRSYRTGASRGVVGEAPDDPRRRDLSEAIDDDDDERPHASVSEAAEQAFNDLLEWRLEYQAYRAGAARGARGRASGSAWSLEALRMLPVARLAAHHRAKSRREQRKPSSPRPPPPPSAGPVHAHVGCGRLGLGLVVPRLADGVLPRGGKIILVQRPSAAWKVDDAALPDGAAIACLVNEVTVASLDVCAEGGDVASRLAASKDGILVLSTASDAMDAVAGVATTTSCSLGPALAKGLEPLVAALRRASKRVRLFAAENDHDAVEAYAKTDEAAAAFNISPLLVDRVCTGRDLARAGAGFTLTTTTEPWRGEIVVMRDEQDDEHGADDDEEDLPFGGDGVYAPDSAAAAQFLHRRKILTVNGTHTTLAFLTLAAAEPPPHKGLPTSSYELVRAVPENPGEDELVDLECEETYRATWCWVVARQLLLLFESDYEVAAAALTECSGAQKDVDSKLCDALLANAKAAIDRLGRGGDQTARVLGAGVVKRYEGRLLPVAKFLETAAKAKPSWLATPLARLLLRKARLTETTLRLSVLGLAADAARFAETPPKKEPAPTTPRKKAPPRENAPTPPPSLRRGPPSPRRAASSHNLFALGGGGPGPGPQ